MNQWHFFALIFLLLGASLLSVIFFLMWLYRSREAANYMRQFIGMEEDLKNAVESANSCRIELEKSRESLRYERQISENLQKELREAGKNSEEKIRAEIELKTREAESKVRAKLWGRMNGDGAQKEHFITHQQERFMKYVSDTSSPEESEEDSILSSARERIALMAQNLYEYSPSAAVEFIAKMARNDNPAIRTNIVQALANIAKPETFEMLFELYSDKDQRVKREVLRNLKALNQKISAGSISVGPETAEKVKFLLTEEKDKGEWIF
jgi:hypothetical protein